MFRSPLGLLFSIHRYYQLTRNCGKIILQLCNYIFFCFALAPLLVVVSAQFSPASSSLISLCLPQSLSSRFTSLINFLFLPRDRRRNYFFRSVLFCFAPARHLNANYVTQYSTYTASLFFASSLHFAVRFLSSFGCTSCGFLVYL